ncbi:hypothetical protein [Microbacterium sp. 77mftsu3.1]|uniref:hypothetical protein n=1 Tax=Microbacterium sp. 77mftsu3.1 TaxID=1761802 RepID=UPI00036CC76D|nr:hypothetical protein [Microbacterium sp. 77mftsu3.1]SDH42193.1 hypothetical protein SAMN04488590_3300 [Microbacterium sp. 77mftsu3.1]
MVVKVSTRSEPERHVVTANAPISKEERAQQLANRLRLLMDLAEAGEKTEVTYADIAEYLTSRGISMSRARWSYLINGHRLVEDVELLNALSDFFEVPHGYIHGEEEPEQVTSSLNLVRAMRAAKVKRYAARTLGDLSPVALRAITQILEAEVSRNGGSTEP